MKIIDIYAGIMCLLLPLAAFGQTEVLTPQANQKGKYGYVSANGEFVISPQYDEAKPFFQGKAIVRKGNHFGVIDENNKTVIPLNYNLISPADENTYMVAVDGKIKDGRLIDEKYGFISTSGQVIIKPEYVEMSEFDRHGLAAIRHKSGKCGFIDRNYHFVIPAEFDYVGLFNNKGVNWLNKGGRPNENGQVRGGRFFLVTADGNMFIPGEHVAIGYFAPNKANYSKEWLNSLKPTYKRIWSDGDQSYYFQKKTYLNTTPGSRIPDDMNGFWTAPDPDGYRNGVYDAEGHTIIEPGKYYGALYPDGEISIVIPKKDQMNYLNTRTGQMVLTKNIDSAFGFRNGYAVCKVGNEYFIVDEKGGCCSKGYDLIFPGKDGMHIVSGRNGFGLIGFDGHEIIPCTAPDIWPIRDGLCIVKVGSSFAYAGKNGFATQAIFSDANNFYQGYTWAKQNGAWDLYDTSFRKITTKPVSSGIYSIESSVFWGKDIISRQYNCYSLKDGSQLFANSYSDVGNFSANRKDVALVASPDDSKRWGVIDLQGNELIPCMFDKELALKAYDMYLENDRRPWTAYDTHFLNLRHNPARNKFSLTNKIDESFWDF